MEVEIIEVIPFGVEDLQIKVKVGDKIYCGCITELETEDDRR